MDHVFNGRLCGNLCGDCTEPLAGMTVRLYRTRSDQNVTALAVAGTKDTFSILTDEQVKAKQGALLGEYLTDADGAFTAVLGDKQGYGGGAFEVDVYCGTVPRRPPTPRMPPPLQFSVTVVQPQWRRTETGPVAAWQDCLSARYWCLVRSRFDAWTICGHVDVCKTGLPVAGVKVSAFDRDWLQDDPLGTAFTDGSGHFRIDYVGADFRKDILGLNIELTGGPDLYFHVETPSGTPLLTESPDRGRAPDRENAGPCFCVELCVPEAPVVTHAWFTRVGDFGIYSDINHLTDGLTSHAVPFGFPGAHGGPGFGFTGGMKLVGDCPAQYPTGGPLMRYRFLCEVIGGGLGLQPVTASQVIAVKVGTRPIVWNVGGEPAPGVHAQDIYVAPFGAPPGTVAPVTPPPGLPNNVDWGPIPAAVMVPDANGWVPIDPAATNGGFSGPLLRLDSTTVVPGGVAPFDGAGNAVSSPKNGQMLRIVFEAEPTTGPTGSTPTLTNPLERVYVNNWSDVNQVGLLQFSGAGNSPCSGLSTALDILYTTDHELMAAWSLGISTAASIPGGVPVLPSGTVPRGVASTFHLDISTWPACSYLVALSTRRRLTDGETDDSGHTNYVTFCKD
jgi:hypothetical protein